MKEVDWDAEKHVSPSGLEFNIDYLKGVIEKQCIRTADQALPTYDYGRENPRGSTPLISADKADFISDCVKERRGEYEEWMTESIDREEARTALDKINSDIMKTAKNGKNELVVKTLYTNEIPRSFEPVTEALKNKGYKIEVQQSQAQGPETPPQFEVIVKFK